MLHFSRYFFRHHRRAVLLALSSMITGLLIFAAASQSQQQQLLQQQQRWGQLSSRQLAVAAGESVIQGDKVSLHAMLSRFVDDPLIDYAAVYDLDNQVLAESGELLSANHKFTADITFQDSIAGHLLIAVNDHVLQRQQGDDKLLLLGLVVLFAGLVFCSSISYRAWHQGRRQHIPPFKLAEQGAVVMSIQLRQHRKAGEELHQLAATLHRLCELYQAELHQANDKLINIYFAVRRNCDQPLLRASCCAYLLRGWLDTASPQLQAGIALTAQQEADQITQLAAQAGDRILLSDECSESAAKISLLQLQQSDLHCQLMGFTAPYSTLLAGQLKSLQQHSERLTGEHYPS